MENNKIEEKKCSKCGKMLPLTEFYSRGSGKSRSECKECHKNYVKNKYQERKQKVDEIKSQCKCKKCGENRVYVLDFHYIDPSIKDMSIARMTSNNNHMDKIEEEITKCIVLCANCHREFHFLCEKENITIEDYLSCDLKIEDFKI